MVNFSRCFPTSSWNAQAQNQNSFVNDVVAIALGALALITAGLMNRTNPVFAKLLRWVVGGMSLIWLFTRFCPTRSQFHHHPHYSPPPSSYSQSNRKRHHVHVNSHPVHMPPQTTYTSYQPSYYPSPGNYGYSFPPSASSYSFTPSAPYMPSHSFPTAHRAPPNDSSQTFYSTPLDRNGGFSAGQPTTTHQPVYQQSSQERTFFQAAVNRN